MDIYRVTNGKISEEWADDDVAAIMAQIGAFNPPGLPDIPGQQPAPFQNSANQSCLGFLGGLLVFA